LPPARIRGRTVLLALRRPTDARRRVACYQEFYGYPNDGPGPGQVALAVSGATASLILAGKFEYLLGREGQGQPPPDVDLTPYGGREMGVSRRHASLRVDGKQLLLMDLHSANGTKLNGEAVPPQEPVRLLDGDEIRLGKLVVHIYFNL
jgi:hypothetical protein